MDMKGPTLMPIKVKEKKRKKLDFINTLLLKIIKKRNHL